MERQNLTEQNNLEPLLNAAAPPRRVTLIGYGALGQAIVAALRGEPALMITDVLVRAGRVADTARKLPPNIRAIASLDQLGRRPDLILEVASHSAVATFVPEALERGIDVALASIGALVDDTLHRRLADSARQGGSQLHILPGAVGAIDALAAYREGNLHDVVYIGRKPPGGWRGTPAADRFDLLNLREATVIYEGTARDAARLFPKNANVAATVALAGLGFDRTRVKLVADPSAPGNVHRIEASADAGSFTIELTGRPLPDNPRTSAMTALSSLRALRNLARPIAI
jgi:aspartate dehydrogenase